jgi:Holliday junction resolvase-like predicted endonuclease
MGGLGSGVRGKGGQVSDLGFRRGRRGEALALDFLMGQEWRILDRNWRDGPRELDAVALRERVLAFVEVKTRSLGRGPAQGSGPALGARDRALASATTSVTWRKRREIHRAARAWVVHHRTLPEDIRSRMFGRPWPSILRFDLVVVLFLNRDDAEVIHMPDAWRPGWSNG